MSMISQFVRPRVVLWLKTGQQNHKVIKRFHRNVFPASHSMVYLYPFRVVSTDFVMEAIASFKEAADKFKQYLNDDLDKDK